MGTCTREVSFSLFINICYFTRYRYFVSNPFAVVRGRPSASLAARLANDEKTRVAQQVKQLGSEGLAEATRKLAEAKAEHDRPIPQNIITSFKIPDVQSISWIPVQTECGHPQGNLAKEMELKCQNASDKRLPFFVQFETVKVNLFNSLLKCFSKSFNDSRTL
jgi:Zn-dependent M16 (insulinase) family peptidase